MWTFFRDARICGAHETTCTAGPAILTDEQPCRKCGEMQKDRKARTAHEAKCTGDEEKNKICTHCGKQYDTMATRLKHEAACPRRFAADTKKESVHADGSSVRECGRKNSYKDPYNDTRPTAEELWTRTPPAPNAAADGGSELAQRTCTCCNRVFNLVATCRKYERQMRQAQED